MNKERLLAALDCAIDDLSEDLLLEALFEAFGRQKAEVDRLHRENNTLQLRLHDEHEQLLEEMKNLRRNPMYGAYGEWHYLVNGTRIGIRAQGGRIVSVYERKSDADYAAQEVPIS